MQGLQLVITGVRKIEKPSNKVNMVGGYGVVKVHAAEGAPACYYRGEQR